MKLDVLTKSWLINAIDEAPNKECTRGLIETIEWMYEQSKDIEMLEYFMGRIIDKDKTL